MNNNKTTIDPISFLNRAFQNAMWKAKDALGSDNTRGTKLYQYQVDFCYLTRNIQCEPSYATSKYIQQAKELIEKLEHEC